MLLARKKIDEECSVRLPHVERGATSVLGELTLYLHLLVGLNDISDLYVVVILYIKSAL